MTARLFLKLIGAGLCLLVLALVAADLLATRVATASYNQNLTRQLVEQARLVAWMRAEGYEVSQESVRTLARAVGARLTVVAPDGRVLADSEAAPEKMENHRHRPEIIQALSGHEGSSIRRSPTIGTDFLYVAVPVNGTALRLAVPLERIDREVDAIRGKMLIAVVLAFLPAVALAALLARYVSGRLGRLIRYASELAKGNFRARLEATGGGELGALGRELNQTGEKLEKMFDELERKHAELEKVERVRKDFVMNVSHELRTPLASIQGYVETLMDGALYDPDNNERFLAIVRQNADRLWRLTDDLISLSQVELESRSFHCVPHPVSEFLDDAAGAIRPVAQKKDLSLRLEPAPDGALALCDGEAVFQILANLLDNAVKFTPEGGQIVLAARALGDHVELSVRDTGIGIPAEDLPRLFERFYRVDKARSRDLGGTGLGLAIVKHLVRAQGGEVRVESVPGLGSTFYFTLPAAQVHAKLTRL